MLTSIRTLYLWTFFLLIISCDYVREQKIPDEIELVSKTLIGTKNIYIITSYKLSNLTNVNLDSWNDNLICEGYSDRYMRIDWQEFYPSETDSVSYFYDILIDSYKDSSNSDEMFISGCKTEWVTDSNGKLNTIYHIIYFLDMNNKVLIEIRSID